MMRKMVRKKEREREREEEEEGEGEKSVRDFQVLKLEFIVFSVFRKKFRFKMKFLFLAKNISNMNLCNQE